MDKLDLKELAERQALKSMTLTPGWEVFLNHLNRERASAVDKLINLKAEDMDRFKFWEIKSSINVIDQILDHVEGEIESAEAIDD